MQPNLSSKVIWPRTLIRIAQHRIAKNSFFDLLALGLPILITLVTTPILVSRMGDNNYGIWILSRSILGFSGLFDLGMTFALVKFMAEYIVTENDLGLSSSITAAYSIYLGMGLLLGICIFALAGPVGGIFHATNVEPYELTRLIRITALGLPAVLLTIGNNAIPRGLQRFEVSTAIRVSQVSMVLGSAVVVTLVSSNLEYIVWSTVFSFWAIAIASSILAFSILKKLQIKIVFSKKYFLAMGRFSFFIFLTTLGSQLFGTVDKLLIGAAFNASYVTYYAVSISVASTLLSLASALSGAFMPAVSSLYAQGHTDKVWQYFKFSTLLVSTIVTVIGIALLVVSSPFLTLWMGPEFADKGLILFRILIIAYMGIALNTPAYHVAIGIGVPWICSVGSIGGGVLTLLLIYFMGSRVGLEGTGWGNFGYWFSNVIVIYIFWALHPRKRLAAIVVPQ